MAYCENAVVRNERRCSRILHRNDQREFRWRMNRHFQIHLKRYDCNVIYKYSQNEKFNIMFGLFTTDERTRFAEYILRDLRRWILK
jgi:hypothetical protein